MKRIIRARSAPALGDDVSAEIRMFLPLDYDESETLVKGRARSLADANEIEDCLAETLPGATYRAILHLMTERESRR